MHILRIHGLDGPEDDIWASNETALVAGYSMQTVIALQHGSQAPRISHGKASIRTGLNELSELTAPPSQTDVGCICVVQARRGRYFEY